MPTVRIMPELADGGGWRFRASAREHSVMGASAGEALDALCRLLPDGDETTFVILQRFRPDDLFSREQQERLGQLMAEWRAARDKGAPFPPDRQAELDRLIELEFRASGERASRVRDEPHP